MITMIMIMIAKSDDENDTSMLTDFFYNDTCYDSNDRDDNDIIANNDNAIDSVRLR